MKLLGSILTEQQGRDLQNLGSFFVQAASGRLYRIDKGRLGNVKVVDPVTKKMLESLCCHPQEGVPDGDTMVMQKLLIETAEETFRSYANITIAGSGQHIPCKPGLLTGEELAKVLPFPSRVRAAA